MPSWSFSLVLSGILIMSLNEQQLILVGLFGSTSFKLYEAGDLCGFYDLPVAVSVGGSVFKDG